jgi:hypothetical protein
MKKYKVIDLQDTDFMEDTHDEPMTLDQLRDRFWCLYMNEEFEDRVEFKNFTKKYIEDLWEVKIIEYKSEEKPEEDGIMEDLYKMEIIDIAVENKDWKTVAFVMAGIAGSEGINGVQRVFKLMEVKYGIRKLVVIMKHIQESGIHSAMNIHTGTDVNSKDVKGFGDFIQKYGVDRNGLTVEVGMKVRGNKTIIKIKNFPSFMGKDLCVSFENWIQEWIKQRLSNMGGKISVDKVSKE